MIQYYQGPYYQQGAGFGGFFRGLFNFMRPILKSPMTQKIGKAVGKEVLKTGVKIGKEVLEGRDFKQCARENLHEAKDRVWRSVTGGGVKKRQLILEEEPWEMPAFKKKKLVKKIEGRKPPQQIKKKRKYKTVLN